MANSAVTHAHDRRESGGYALPLPPSRVFQERAYFLLMVVPLVLGAVFGAYTLVWDPTNPIESTVWLLVCPLCAAIALLRRNSPEAPVWALAVTITATNSMFPLIPNLVGSHMLGLIALLMLWTAAIVPPTFTAVFGAYIIVGLTAYGVQWEATVGPMQAPGHLAMPVTAAIVAMPVGLAIALDRALEAVDLVAVGELRRVDERRRVLERDYVALSAELEVSREQLMQAQKLKTVGTMASGLAHELNNILTPIRGLSELLAQGVGHDQAQRYGQRILDSAVSAAQITGALLTYTRQGTFSPVRSNARQLLATQILPVLSRSLPRGIALEVDLDRQVSIDVDRLLFQQAITNLVFNAVDAMPDGGTIQIVLSVSSAPALPPRDAARTSTGRAASPSRGGPREDNLMDTGGPVTAHEDDAPRSARIDVRDTGIGIPPELMPRIFDPFFTTKAVGAGTGLGLAMVQGTVERHGGRVEVHSEPGFGTTFSLYIPLADSAGEGTLPAWPALATSGSGPVVMVVSEDTDLTDEIEELLEATQCAPLCSNDPRAARTMLTEMGDRIDLLILDIDMESVDASDTYRMIRELLPQIPIVLLTERPHAMAIPTDRLVTGAATRTLRKPLDQQMFATLVTDALQTDPNHR